VTALDPQARAFLDGLAAANRPPLSTLTPVEARAANAKLSAACAGTPLPLASVEDREIAGPRGPIRIRIYTPEHAPAAAPLPVLAYYHGGGFVIGDLAMVDETCRLLADSAGCIVVSVDYRLAPEHPFPAPRDDAYAAAAWIAREAASFGGDPRRVAVGGDSAGGTLASSVALLARDRGGPRLAFQLLVYPGSDRDLERASMREFGDGYFITLDAIRWFGRMHLAGPIDPADPFVALVDVRDLSRVPPALVILAECDPLRDGGRLYAARLRDAGVPVEVIEIAGMIHGFFAFPSVFDAARRAIASAAAALRRAFAEIERVPEVGSLPTQ
jgi:acetyl esterase